MGPRQNFRNLLLQHERNLYNKELFIFSYHHLLEEINENYENSCETGLKNVPMFRLKYLFIVYSKAISCMRLLNNIHRSW